MRTVRAYTPRAKRTERKNHGTSFNRVIVSIERETDSIPKPKIVPTSMIHPGIPVLGATTITKVTKNKEVNIHWIVVFGAINRSSCMGVSGSLLVLSVLRRPYGSLPPGEDVLLLVSCDPPHLLSVGVRVLGRTVSDGLGSSN